MGVGVSVMQDEKGNRRGFIGSTQQSGFQMTKGDRERLRAELAGKAMQPIISKTPVTLYLNGSDEAIEQRERTARGAVGYADALLAELERTAEDPVKAGGTE